MLSELRHDQQHWSRDGSLSAGAAQSGAVTRLPWAFMSAVQMGWVCSTTSTRIITGSAYASGIDHDSQCLPWVAANSRSTAAEQDAEVVRVRPSPREETVARAQCEPSARNFRKSSISVSTSSPPRIRVLSSHHGGNSSATHHSGTESPASSLPVSPYVGLAMRPAVPPARSPGPAA